METRENKYPFMSVKTIEKRKNAKKRFNSEVGKKIRQAKLRAIHSVEYAKSRYCLSSP